MMRGLTRARWWLVGRVNRRWPVLASLIFLGPERFLQDLQERIEASEPEPEKAPSRGKPGSRPEDLVP